MLRFVIQIALWLTLLWNELLAQRPYWEPTSFPGQSVSITSIAVSSLGDIFVGSASTGIYRSTDNGASWTQTNAGLTDLHINTLTVTPGGFIFAGSMGGLFRSMDGGDSWSRLRTGFITCSSLSPQGDVYYGSYLHQLYRSTDDGGSWSLFNLDTVIATNIVSIQTVAVGNSGHIFFGTTSPLGDTASGIYRSTDVGVHWHRAQVCDQNAILVAQSGTIFAGGVCGMVRSMNNGLSWQTVVSGYEFYSLARNSLDHIFAGSDQGVFRSTDNGTSWELLNSGLGTYPWITALGVAPSGYAFAGTPFNGLYRSSTPTTTAVFEHRSLNPTSTVLEQNYPNPFNPSTRISFRLSSPGNVTLKVRDVLGTEIETLVEGMMNSGTHSVRWDATGRASSVYFYSMMTATTTQTRMMIFVR